MVRLVVLAPLLLTVSLAVGQDEFVVVGRVTRIVDADTIDVEIDSGPARVRFDSVDAGAEKRLKRFQNSLPARKPNSP
jgi:hypothetical protein